MGDFKPRVIMVTGAAGFIGCNFVRFMLSKYSDIKIISFDKLTYAGKLENLHDVMEWDNHVFVKGDICDRAVAAKALRDYQVDTVVHFAAESHVDNSITGPEVFFQTNVMGTLSLIDEARKYWQDEMGWDESECRFHHVSTDEVYGSLQIDEPAFTEESPYRPNSPYAASKAASDHLVRSYYKTYGLPVTISNCSNNYGPYQHQEKFIPTVIKACQEGRKIPIYGQGANRREWLQVEDHCLAIDLILSKASPGSVYNVGSGFAIPNLEITKMICNIFDNAGHSHDSHCQLIEFVTDRKGHDFRYSIDSSAIKSELGWKPQHDFKTSIKQQIEKGLLVNA